MAGVRNRGPFVSLGPLIDGRPDVTDGPSLKYQGDGFLDPRYSAANKDSEQIALFPAWLHAPSFVITDNIPSAVGTAALATAQTIGPGVAMQLITAAAGNSTLGNPSLCPGVTINTFQSASTVSVLAIDFGFTGGTTTASNATVASIPDSSVFYVGQRIVIGGAANAAKTAAQICTVTSIPSSSTIVVTPAPAASLTGAPIGSANAYGQFPSQLAATGAWPYQSGGEGVFLSPSEAICLGTSISGVSAATGATFTVTGYDTYGVIMHENITHTGGATTAYGKKAFKYISNVTPITGDAHNYTAGVSDLFGFNLRSDKFEYTTIYWNGTQFAGPAAPGWTQALQASSAPSSATAADVRGTIQVSASGPSATGATATTSNGTTARLFIEIDVTPWQTLYSNNQSTVPLLGYTQF